ncbi:response regulator [Methylobacter psychrophilus]|uniref:response regulator n=1 Tax=Methylobacter psychrophilus TaxID=96941 RepID=UPI0021D49DB7|nr:two-component system response regulator [Methylobacter psychrophilus]
MVSEKNTTILIIDDASESLSVLSELLRPQYRVLATTTGKSGCRIAGRQPKPDLILLDVMMPDMDGYEVLKQLRNNPITWDIPVIFLTALANIGDEERGLQLGAADYITKPIIPAVVLARVHTQLEAKLARDWMKDQNATLEAEVTKRMTENDFTQRVSIQALARLAETRDLETGNHILRTQGYVQRLANGLTLHPRFAATLTDNYINLLSRSAPLHDIGKVGIPDHILHKPGKLDSDEWAIMQTHAKLGSDAIEQAEQDIDIHLAFLTLAKEIAHWHHEKWDGSGYPDGLAKDDIPVSARLMAIADVFDALISARTYKPAMSYTQARDIIAAGRGKHFDPDMTDAFLDGFDDFVAIAERYLNLYGKLKLHTAIPDQTIQTRKLS